MASIPFVMRRMLKTCRSEERLPSDEEFEANKPAYKETLEAVRSLAGEESLDEIGEWAVEWTKQKGRLPSPDRFRKQARQVLEREGIEIPADSILAAS
ncbi:MAG: hypothetical protein PPP58_04010 [Natronomonas sp.]